MDDKKSIKKTKKKVPTWVIAILIIIILFLLFTLLPLIVTIPHNDFKNLNPTISSIQLLQVQVNNPGELQYTEGSLLFNNQENKSISSTEVVNFYYENSTKISSNQIIFLTNDLLSDFSTSNNNPGNSLIYLGKKGNYRIGAICDFKEQIDNDLNRYPDYGSIIDTNSISSLFSDEFNGKTICILFPQIAN
jgi:hypothetical protein